MSVFNWIDATALCPVCRPLATIRAQSHVAASFDGDERGRFCQALYALGEPMRWWPPGDSRFAEWKAGAHKSDGNFAEECCYSDCLRCGADLYTVIRFSDVKPEEVTAVGTVADWPPAYPR